MRTHSLKRRDFILQGLASAGGLAFAPVLTGETSAAKKLKYGVVGSGNRSRNYHLPMLRDYLPEIEVVALCDITPEALAEGLRICGGSTVGYSDYNRMLSEHPDLDAVIVIVPNFLHAGFTVQALEAGKHVLYEKPMAISGEDALAVHGAAKAARTIHQKGSSSSGYRTEANQRATTWWAKRMDTVEWPSGA